MPLPAFTETVTVSGCVMAMLEEDGVTVTVGVALETVTPVEVPVALL